MANKLNKETFVESLKNMTLLEIKELVEGLKESFGIDPASMVVAGAAGTETKKEQEEKTEFKVILKKISSNSSNRIKMIKAICEITNLGLMDSKTLVDTPGAVIKENTNKQDAESIKERLEKLDASVELE